MSDSRIRYMLADVAKCNGKNGSRIWIVLHDNVYDVTDYRHRHPGTAELIEEYAGTDATSEFDNFGHSSDARKILKEYLIGELDDEDKRANRNKKKYAVPNELKMDGSKKQKHRKYSFLKIFYGKCI